MTPESMGMPGQMTIEEAFGEVLREIRLSRGLSQEELADACGRHRTYISMLERGISSPSLRTLFMLAETLEVKTSEFLRRIEKRAQSFD